MKEATVSSHAAPAAMSSSLDAVIRAVLCLYIAILPFEQLLVLERNGFILVIGLLVLWCVLNRRHFFTRTAVDVPFVLFIAWVAATIPFATFPDYSAKEFGKLLQQGLIFYTVVFFFKDDVDRMRIARILLAVLAIVSLVGISEFIQNRLAVHFHGGSPVLIKAMMSAETWLTTYLVLLLPLSLACALFEKRKWVQIGYASITGIATLCLLLTLSRAGVVALLAEIWITSWFVRGKNWLAVAVAVTLLIMLAGVVSLGYDPVTQSFTKLDAGKRLPGKTDVVFTTKHRFQIWRFSVEQIVAHPIFGIGYGKGNFKRVFGDRQEDRSAGHFPVFQSGTHNVFLDIALSVGVPGLLLFIWILIRIAHTVLKQFYQQSHAYNRALPLALLVSIIGLSLRLLFDQMFIGSLAVLFWVYVAIAMNSPHQRVSSVS